MPLECLPTTCGLAGSRGFVLNVIRFLMRRGARYGDFIGVSTSEVVMNCAILAGNIAFSFPLARALTSSGRLLLVGYLAVLGADGLFQ
jgi:hypothetical protein